MERHQGVRKTRSRKGEGVPRPWATTARAKRCRSTPCPDIERRQFTRWAWAHNVSPTGTFTSEGTDFGGLFEEAKAGGVAGAGVEEGGDEGGGLGGEGADRLRPPLPEEPRVGGLVGERELSAHQLQPRLRPHCSSRRSLLALA